MKKWQLVLLLVTMLFSASVVFAQDEELQVWYLENPLDLTIQGENISLILDGVGDGWARIRGSTPAYVIDKYLLVRISDQGWWSAVGYIHEFGSQSVTLRLFEADTIHLPTSPTPTEPELPLQLTEELQEWRIGQAGSFSVQGETFSLTLKGVSQDSARFDGSTLAYLIDHYLVVKIDDWWSAVGWGRVNSDLSVEIRLLDPDAIHLPPTS